LYIYDYFLTIGDEVRVVSFRVGKLLNVMQVKFAWKGRKTWRSLGDLHFNGY